MKVRKIILMVTVALSVFIGCSKPENDTQVTTKLASDPVDLSVYSSNAKSAELAAVNFPDASMFCESSTYKFIAGQNMNAGIVLVANTKDSLFLEITSTAGFQNVSENVKIWIGATMPFTDRPSAGQFPFKHTVSQEDTVIYIGFSFAELELKCDAAFYIAVHGDVLVADGNSTSSQTAWGGDIEGEGSSWWYYINYTPKCCEPPECKLSIESSVTNVKCFGESTGAIDLTVTDGVAPFTFSWSNGASTEDLSGIPAGSYSVVVTDANKCVSSKSNIVVGQPESGVSATSVITNISAFGASDGAINVTTSGGTPPYAYLWNTGATTEDLSNLGPGTYSVKITDANGCNTLLGNLLVQQPAECKIKVTSEVTDVKCFGASTGSIDLTISDGAAPFTFAWSNGATTEDLMNIPSGTYSVTVTDANKCATTLNNIVVAQPETGVSATSQITNISAYGAADGAIDVTASGGNPPYAFLWNTGATTEDLSNLGPGTYSVTITDANGCNTSLRNLLVQQPDRPKGKTAFMRKTYEPMVHCFLDLDMNKDGIKDFTSWGWTNGALTEDPAFISKYELFIDASGCDVSGATKVGDVEVLHYGGTTSVKFIMLPGYGMSETALYVGNDMLPKYNNAYTIDPARYPYRHGSLGNAGSDTYTVSATGDIYLIGYAVITNDN